MLAAGFVAAGVTPAWACACGGYLPDAQSQAKLPDADVKPDLLFAGGVEDDALAKPADDRDPGRITDDFTFAPAATDDEFQRVEYITKNDGLWSTIGVLLGGVLLLGAGAAVIARVLVRRSSTGRA